MCTLRVVLGASFLILAFGCGSSSGTDAGPGGGGGSSSGGGSATGGGSSTGGGSGTGGGCAATDTPDNCGTCGTVCPGYMKPGANVTCVNSQICQFNCSGESYDVDGNPQTGCEVADTVTGNHTAATATPEGHASACDTNFTFSGSLPSDNSFHLNPSIDGFDIAHGSAPDFYTLIGDGMPLCQSDVVVTLTMNTTAQASCYQLDITTDQHHYSCTASPGGNCSINHIADQFSDGTTLTFEVSRTCTTGFENATYTISGHL